MVMTFLILDIFTNRIYSYFI